MLGQPRNKNRALVELINRRHELANYQKDKMSLQNAKSRLHVLETQLRDLTCVQCSNRVNVSPVCNDESRHLRFDTHTLITSRKLHRLSIEEINQRSLLPYLWPSTR